MFLFFDTETTGVPKNYKAPASDLSNWPRLVQLGYLFYDQNKKLIASGDYIIKPNGFTIPVEASKVHGITTERALKEGKDLKTVLSDILDQIKKADYLIAHNMAFDEKILGAELLRNGFSNVIEQKKRICTMEATTEFCAIPGPYGYKWPKLSELHIKLFGKDFDGAHNAVADIEATAHCFWKLTHLNIIKVKIEPKRNNEKYFDIEQALEDYYEGENHNYELLYNEYLVYEKQGAFNSDNLLSHFQDRIKPTILVPYRKGELWGFSDYNKNIKIPCQFLSVNEFHEGLAFVKVNDKWGFINESGMLINSAAYNNLSYSYFKNGISVVRIGKKVGVINRLGKIIIPIIYDEIYRCGNLFQVKLINKYGLINVSNKAVVNIIYDDLIYVSESLIRVEKEKKYGFINIKEEVTIPIVYDKLSLFYNGLAKFRNGDETGYINEKGKIVLKTDYDDSEDFREGYAPVKKNNKWGFINTIGWEIVPPIYDEVNHFNEGLSSVRIGNKWGVINSEHKVIVPLIYEYIGEFNNSLALVELKGKTGFIDNTGKIVIPIIYDRAANHFRQMIRVLKGKYWGIIDSSGKIVIELKYDSISAFKDKITRVKINGKYGYINIDGVEFWDDLNTINVKEKDHMERMIDVYTKEPNDFNDEFWAIEAANSIETYRNELTNHYDDFEAELYFNSKHNPLYALKNWYPKQIFKPKPLVIIEERKITLRDHVKTLINEQEFKWLTDRDFEKTKEGLDAFIIENKKRLNFLLDIFKRNTLPYIEYDNFRENILCDIEGTKYKTIKVSNTHWMAQNLSTTYFKNGDKIPEAKTADEWDKYGRENKPCWCFYDNDSSKGNGKLYNWYAVNDKRGLAPAGWKIPSVIEWRLLIGACNEKEVGYILKSQQSWKNKNIFFNGNGVDSIGFNAKPTGYRNASGYNFEKYGEECWFWSSTSKPDFPNPSFIFPKNLNDYIKFNNQLQNFNDEWDIINQYSKNEHLKHYQEWPKDEALCYRLSYDHKYVFNSFWNKSYGLAVRCVKRRNEYIIDWYKKRIREDINTDRNSDLELSFVIPRILDWVID